MNKEIKIMMHAFLNAETSVKVKALEQICMEKDKASLKLELDYKENVANEEDSDTTKMNEFLCYSGDTLIGYVGLCGFNGIAVEVNGMVDPDYRRQGIFTGLMKGVLEEYKKRNEQELLLLCDSVSVSGQAFMKTMDASYSFSEYEMTLALTDKELFYEASRMTFKKATNEDALVIAKQNAIYFGKPLEEIGRPLPETEEKRGMTIYLASLGEDIIGKVNIILNNNETGIYGVGVLPEYRSKGYGREILEFAVTKSKELGVATVMLQVEAKNANALNLYTSCGFEVAYKMDYYALR